ITTAQPGKASVCPRNFFPHLLLLLHSLRGEKNVHAAAPSDRRRRYVKQLLADVDQQHGTPSAHQEVPPAFSNLQFVTGLSCR
ncbi:MAG: hypothetical protein WA874_00100, partial [Chryseosolibacter sp.]